MMADDRPDMAPAAPARRARAPGDVGGVPGRRARPRGLGAGVGAGGRGALLDAGASPRVGTLCVGAAILALLLASDRHLLRYGGQRDTPFFAMPRGVVLVVGGLCFVSFLAEGAMLDWSAVFLTSRHAMDAAQAGAGYAVFSVAGTAGPLVGDPVVPGLRGPP